MASSASSRPPTHSPRRRVSAVAFAQLVGPLAHSVQACADADAVMAGQAPAPVKACRAYWFRFGVAADFLADAEPAVLRAFGLVLRALERQRAIVREASLSDLVAEMRAVLSDANIVPFEAAQSMPNAWRRAQMILIRACWREFAGAEIAEPQYLLSLRRRIAYRRHGPAADRLGLSHPADDAENGSADVRSGGAAGSRP